MDTVLYMDTQYHQVLTTDYGYHTRFKLEWLSGGGGAELWHTDKRSLKRKAPRKPRSKAARTTMIAFVSHRAISAGVCVCVCELVESGVCPTARLLVCPLPPKIRIYRIIPKITILYVR